MFGGQYWTCGCFYNRNLIYTRNQPCKHALGTASRCGSYSPQSTQTVFRNRFSTLLRSAVQSGCVHSSRDRNVEADGGGAGMAG